MFIPISLNFLKICQILVPREVLPKIPYVLIFLQHSLVLSTHNPMHILPLGHLCISGKQAHSHLSYLSVFLRPSSTVKEIKNFNSNICCEYFRCQMCGLVKCSHVYGDPTRRDIQAHGTISNTFNIQTFNINTQLSLASYSC